MKNVGKGNEESEPTVEKKRKETTMAIFQQSDEAIVAAEKLLTGFEALYEDEERRAQATGTSGVVAAGIVNYALDAAEEKDPYVKSELKKRAITTGLEMFTGFVKTTLAGENRRRNRRKGK